MTTKKMVILAVAFCLLGFGNSDFAQSSAIDDFINIIDGSPTTSICEAVATDCGSTVSCEGDSCSASDGTSSASCTSTTTVTSYNTDGSVKENTVIAISRTISCLGSEGTSAYFLFDAVVLPETLNLKNTSDRSITVFIDVSSVVPGIDANTLYFDVDGNKIYAETSPQNNGNNNPEHNLYKFNLNKLESCELIPQDIEEAIISITFNGTLVDGSPFKAVDKSIRVICNGN